MSIASVLYDMFVPEKSWNSDYIHIMRDHIYVLLKFYVLLRKLGGIHALYCNLEQTGK